MINPHGIWKEVNASDVTNEDFLSIMRNYSEMGMTLYVGTDSMLYSTYCTFSCIVLGAFVCCRACVR